jgi:hypothetical protein
MSINANKKRMVNIWYGEKYSNDMALTTNPEPHIIVTKISPICPFLLSVISLPLSMNKDACPIGLLLMNNLGVLIHFTQHSDCLQADFCKIIQIPDRGA